MNYVYTQQLNNLMTYQCTHCHWWFSLIHTHKWPKISKCFDWNVTETQPHIQHIFFFIWGLFGWFQWLGHPLAGWCHCTSKVQNQLFSHSINESISQSINRQSYPNNKKEKTNQDHKNRENDFFFCSNTQYNDDEWGTNDVYLASQMMLKEEHLLC